MYHFPSLRRRSLLFFLFQNLSNTDLIYSVKEQWNAKCTHILFYEYSLTSTNNLESKSFAFYFYNILGARMLPDERVCRGSWFSDRTLDGARRPDSDHFVSENKVATLHYIYSFPFITPHPKSIFCVFKCFIKGGNFWEFDIISVVLSVYQTSTIQLKHYKV